MQKSCFVARKDTRSPYDYTIIIPVLCLVIIGLLLTHSASSHVAAHRYGDSYHFLKRQVLFCLLGLSFMIVAKKIPCEWYLKFVYPLLVISLGLLVLRLIPGTGGNLGGIGPWFRSSILSSCPSCMIISSLVLYLAYSMSNKANVASFSRGLLPDLVVPSVFILLIFLQPAVGGSTQGPGIRQADYETAIIITCVAVILLCIGPRNRLQICMTLLVVFCLAAGWLLLTLSPYQKARLVNFFTPWKEEKRHYYGSVVDIRTVIRPKRIFGVGFGHGKAKFWYLRHAHTKDIMAVASEELGWAGVIAILMIFGILVTRGIQVGFGTHDPYRRYLALGVTLLVALQVLLHAGRSMALLPFAGGVSLPLISYGGPFLAMTLFGMGVLLNVSSRT